MDNIICIWIWIEMSFDELICILLWILYEYLYLTHLYKTTSQQRIVANNFTNPWKI